MRLPLACATLVLLSCGGGGGGPASGSAAFTGSVRGQSFSPRDATAGNLSFNGTGIPGQAAVIAITSAAGLCPLVAAGKEPKSTHYLVLTAFRLQPNYTPVPPPAPGTYTVGARAIENAGAVFAATDANCQVLTSSQAIATSGSITFTSVGSRYSGSYDLNFDFGDHVTGTFDAPACAAASAIAPGSGALACQ